MIIASIIMANQVVGLILAGGRSSRMGQDKSQMLWRGKSLIDHARGTLLEAGCESVLVLGGDHDESIGDDAPFSGPGFALSNYLNKQESGARFLLMPVDMPAVTATFLKWLKGQDKTTIVHGKPLPAYIVNSAEPIEKCAKLRDVFSQLAAISIDDIPIEFEVLMGNINTPEDFSKLQREFGG